MTTRAKWPHSRHDWVDLGMKEKWLWQCTTCLATALSADSVGRRRVEPCQGVARRLRGVLSDSNGHRLAVADVDDGPCLLCVARGAWCRRKPKLLCAPCRGRCSRAAAGQAALKRLKQGFLPLCEGYGYGDLHKVYGVHPLSPSATVGWSFVKAPGVAATPRSQDRAHYSDEEGVGVSCPPLEARRRALSVETVADRVAYLMSAVRSGGP
jgi:hypothetical protein